MMPQPSVEARQHQQKLYAHLEQAAASQKGCLSFAEFMEKALYAPGLGYYSAGLHKFGAQGDFVTAPEISALFSQCLAVQCQQILSELSQPIILELGAGSGKMAADLLNFLAAHQALPQQYWILEVSADLKARQQHYLQQHCPDYFANIVWLSQLPQPFEGIILANEVIDAMPVHLFKIAEDNSVLEGIVRQEGNRWQLGFEQPITPFLQFAVQNLQQRLPEPLTAGYTSEILLTLDPWIASLSQCLNKGVMLFIDYGFPSHEFYHPSRDRGTLMCHYRHFAHPDPMLNIGLQDITAHVDFTALALAAHKANLEVAGFTHQAGFLLANDLLTLAQDLPSTGASHQYNLSQQIQRLTAPHEMGELFKVIALSKDLDLPLKGFALFDQRHRL